MSDSKAFGANLKPLVNVSTTNDRSEKAVRSFNSALRHVLENHPDDILPEWSTDDLPALLSNIIRYQCDKSGVEIFAKTFTDTSVSDILSVIEKLRQFNREASRHRFILPQPGHIIAPDADEAQLEIQKKLSTSNKSFMDWSSGAIMASRARKIPDETPVLLPKTVVNTPVETPRANVPISTSPFMRCNNLMGSPNYERIYQHVGSMLSSRCANKARSLDAAILLNILDDLDVDTDKFAEHDAFFREALKEMMCLDSSEFKVDVHVSEQNIGPISTNVFGFPDELFDLSPFLKES